MTYNLTIKLIHHDCENIILKYGDMKVDLKDYTPYIEYLNEVKVPNFKEENKRLRGIILYNSNKLHFTVLDSVVVMTRTIRAINLVDSVITISDADIRRIELWGCKQIVINIFLSQIQAENVFILL